MSGVTLQISKEDEMMPHLVGIGLMLAFLLPHTSTALLLVNPLLCLFYQCYKQNRVWYRGNMIVLIPILVSFLLNLSQGVSMKAIIATITILLYFICFPMVGKVRLPNQYLYLTLILIVFSQFIYLFNIPFLNVFLDKYYPIEGVLENGINYMRGHINSNNIFDFRLGGLYRNSNNCARYLTFLLAVFLVLNADKPLKKNLFFVTLAFIAVLLTGSRTGFFVSSLLVLVFIWFDKQISSTWKTSIIIVAIAFFVFFLVSGSSTFRALNVVKGFNDSANMKFDAFFDYLEHENSIQRILFGYLDEERFTTSNSAIMAHFDAEYGYLIFQYGFVGFIAILTYFFCVFKRLNRIERVFFITLFWMISSTIVTSFRAFFIFMLLLSIVYNNSKTYR